MTEPSGFTRPVRGSRWSDDQSRQALQSIVEALAEVSGFDVVGVSAARDDGYLHLLCLAGPEDAREALLDTLAPTGMLLDALETAEDWGSFKYLPHDRHQLDIGRWGWVSEAVADVRPGTWHPEDLLVAPLHGDDGRLIAVLGLDAPRDGRVPDAAQRAALEAYARHACRAVVATLEQQRLAEQIRLASAAADIVRRASGSMSAEDVLVECASAILEGFRAQRLWTQLLGEAPSAVHDERPVPPPADLVQLLERYAEAAWGSQDVGIFAPDRHPPPPLARGERDAMLAFLHETGAESLLVVPLGAGRECFGWIGISRGRAGAEWSEGEATVALDIGRDLGRALANARMHERERELVRELQEVADYKSHLIATVSHELRTPLTSIVGFLEILGGDETLSAGSRTAVAAIERGSTRLSRIVEELLVLHRAADTEIDTDRVVDLVPLVAQVLELHRDPAGRRRITLDARLPDRPLEVVGSAHELEHVVANLVGNAVKYTPDGGRIRVSLDVADDGALLTCTDDGIGIAATDQPHVFDEFYRSAAPEAARQAGTGLGLAIVRRLVARHRGRIELDSEPGRGSTFRVWLPAG
jgi:signal transduction histidine kinase